MADRDQAGRTVKVLMKLWETNRLLVLSQATDPMKNLIHNGLWISPFSEEVRLSTETEHF